MLPETTARRVRVRGHAADTPALRLAISRQLQSADLRMRGASPASVLLVRTLRDPLPGCIRANPAAAATDARWEEAVRRQLDRLRERAARPVRGRVESRCEAILFADEAEMIACLALALVASPGDPPWWQTALSRQTPLDSVESLLEANAALLPAVFGDLVTWDALEAFVAHVPDAAACRLVARIAATTGAPFDLVGAMTSAERDTGPSGDHPPSEPDDSGQAAGETPATNGDAPTAEPPPATRSAGARHAARAPWHDLWRPRASSSLSSRQELLAGFALAMHRTSPRARSAAFATAAARWLRSATEGSAQERPPGTRGPDEARTRTPAAPVPSRPEPDDPVAAVVGATIEPAPSAPPLPESGSSVPAHQATPPLRSSGPGLSASVLRDPTPGTRDRSDTPTRTDPDPRNDAVGASDPPRPTDETPDRRCETGVRTSLGGLLYLVNAMERLGLPDCFEADCALASTAGPVGTFEGLARALLGPLSGEDETDPLWPAIAALDGRHPGEHPRAEGLRADVLRLPADWLGADAAALAPLRWTAGEGRLCLESAAGFPVAWVPCGSEGLRQTAVEAARLRAHIGRAVLERAAPGHVWHREVSWLAERGWPPPLARWLDFVSPFLRWRLARALGLGDGTHLDALHDLARLPAHVFVGDTHIDLVASLEAVRLPVRMAGLDRSPGWLPGWQRVVRFHFE